MKGKEPSSDPERKKSKPDLESVKKLLKKKELQTSVLKKIIEQNNPLDK